MTYIEIVLAIAIITYIALGFTQVFLNSIKSAKASEYKTLASNKIVNWFESHRSDYDALKVTYGEFHLMEKGELAPGVAYGIFSRIGEVVLGAKGRYKKIDMKIKWRTGNGEKELVYSTIKAKYD